MAINHSIQMRYDRTVPRSAGSPSLASVGRDLGISAATVSNVFNRPHLVSGDLRARVLAHAERVGYAGPHPAARQLRRGRSDVIGLVFTDELSFALSDPASVGFLQGLARAAEGSGRGLLLLPVGARQGGDATSGVKSAVVDGLIAYSVPDDDPDLTAAFRRRLPVVVVDQPGPVPGADWVGLDDRGAARELIRLVTSLGHQRVGIVTSRLAAGLRNGPATPERLGSVTYAVQRERLAGAFEALAEAGVGPAQVPVEERFEVSRAAGAAALGSLLSHHPGLTAVVCLADVLALGVLEGARDRGLSVPGDLTVTGFDDVPDAAAAGLTTVRQPLADKGALACELLLRLIARRQAGAPGPQVRRILPTSLEVRASTGVPPARAG